MVQKLERGFSRRQGKRNTTVSNEGHKLPSQADGEASSKWGGIINSHQAHGRCKNLLSFETGWWRTHLLHLMRLAAGS